MLPIQFIFLLIIVSLPSQFAQAAKDAGGTMPSVNFVSVPLAFASLWLTQLALVAWVLWRTRKAIRLLHEPTASATPIALLTDRIFARARWLTCLITAAHLFSTPIPKTAFGWFAGTHILKYLLLPEFLFLAPAVLAWLAIWTASYRVESAIRERSMPFNLARGQRVHEMPSLGQYVVMQMRHSFYPILFLLFQGFVTALAALITRFTPSDPKGNLAQSIATIATVIPLFLMLPFLLTRMWSTEPLGGALRQRLDRVAELYGLRFRNIRLWRSHNMLINAAIVGWIPRARYFLMSDALVESFSDQQLESVFAHEVGHGVHRHLHWLILSFAGVLALAGGLAGLAIALLPLNPAQGDVVAIVLSAVLSCGLVAGAIALISPRFEHQADWFACRHMALMLRESSAPQTAAAPPDEPPPAALRQPLTAAPTPAENITVEQYVAGAYPHTHTAASQAAPPSPAKYQETGTPPVELAGAEVFVSALEAIIATSHRDRTRRGWFHPSVANRVALVRDLAVNPMAEARFNRTMRRTRLGILGLAVLGMGALIALASLPTPPGAPAAPAHAQG